MINLAVLANTLKDINIIEIIAEFFIPFVLLAMGIKSLINGLKFCFGMLRNS